MNNLDLDAPSLFGFRCEDELEAVQEAGDELDDAELGRDVTCDVYGLFSGQCAAAAAYAYVKDVAYEWALDDYLDCLYAV